ncbi:hypothetical protein J2S04_000718 [Alicyclobacillus tengchongensis]|uniref:Uncharacterized protein n=2 Tax=Alicyclobacillus tolerans TaxID=90970 RepID=A0ABT9LU48_9BACL|nr:hypothetical protein [Alicyclobacillus tengchongensis]SHK83944.1 hypothetical protein SAMN05443507_1249 [Alicyclobacillus montanus]
MRGKVVTPASPRYSSDALSPLCEENIEERAFFYPWIEVEW